MKSTVFWALVGLNAVLLFTFAGQFNHLNRAQAQLHRPADYLLVPGRVNGSSTSLVYIIDSTNGKLGAMAYDDSTRTLQTMQPIDLNRIYTIAAQGQRR
ncbi:MAG: hypothetical protein ABSD28_20415 [Tepidisphaeraceae bacterium]|jgi:hypothetical protein